MAKPTHSMRELMNNSEQQEQPKEHMPSFNPKSKFSCPLSTSIMWYHDFEYKSCPVSPNHRDMKACEKCIHGGDRKNKQKAFTQDIQTDAKDTRGVDKRTKTAIPKIGKSYTSD
jgi:hypothetical protein